mgnify:CR=1 FL=1
MVGSAYTKWRNKPAEERTWISANKFFRSALRDAQARNKIEGVEGDYAANATIHHATNARDADAFLDKYEEAFDNLAMAVTAKQQTLNTVIENNQRLVQTNARLEEEIAALRPLLGTTIIHVTKMHRDNRTKQMRAASASIRAGGQRDLTLRNIVGHASIV